LDGIWGLTDPTFVSRLAPGDDDDCDCANGCCSRSPEHGCRGRVR
jgi:hypothetical protein